MKKILLLASVACLAAANASAFDFNPYVAAKAKYSFARHEVKLKGVEEGKYKMNDKIWGGSIAVGNTYGVANGAFRIELEYTANSDAKKDGVKAKTQGLLFNVYYDFDLRTTIPVTPYVGVGMGWGRTEYKGDGTNKNNGVSAQIGAGLSYRICPHTSLDLGYRYITYGDFDKEYRVPGHTYEKFEYRPRAHEILLGVRYDF